MTSVKKRKLLIKQAIEAGDLGQLIFLLENEEKIWKSMARKRRDEALMHALVVGDESIFKYLLSHGAVVDMHLIDFLPGDSVELLLDSGWDINTIMPSSGHTVLW